MWVLRFNDRRTSMGFALSQEQDFKERSTEQIWDGLLEKYPSLHKLINDLQLAPQPGKILRSGRLQRRLTGCFGDGWVALPHTAGFVDPLFSSGIAHTLAGVKKIAGIISQNFKSSESLNQDFKEYEKSVFAELKLIDQLVAGCYKTMAHFELFNAWSMLYFAATITYEQRLLQNKPAGYFLGADDPYIQEIVQKTYTDLLKLITSRQPTSGEILEFTGLVKDRIRPINTAGLLDPSVKNMYRHTTADL